MINDSRANRNSISLEEDCTELKLLFISLGQMIMIRDSLCSISSLIMTIIIPNKDDNSLTCTDSRADLILMTESLGNGAE